MKKTFLTILGVAGAALTINAASSSKEEFIYAEDDTSKISANPAPPVPFAPVHRPLVEEYTGLWCQWCPRGFVGMEEVNAHYGDDVVVVCYHNKDDMAITDIYPIEVTGYPTGSVDRTYTVDPYNGYIGSETDREPGIFHVINNRINETPEATIDVTNVETGEFGIKFDIETVFCFQPTSSKYEVGYLITANGLTDPSWGQVNAYAGMTGFEGTPLEMFTLLPPVAFGLVFNDVAVNVEAMNGIPDSLPSIEVGPLYVNSVTIPKSGIHLTDNLDSLVVNAFVIDKTTGRIVNANKAAAYHDNQSENTDSGIEEIGFNLMIEQEYFDISGRKIETPTHGIYIVKSRMEDGSIKTEKRVLR